MITKHSFNYGMVYLPNGCIMKEGYLEKWEYSGSGSYVTLVFPESSGSGHPHYSSCHNPD